MRIKALLFLLVVAISCSSLEGAKSVWKVKGILKRRRLRELLKKKIEFLVQIDEDTEQDGEEFCLEEVGEGFYCKGEEEINQQWKKKEPGSDFE